MIAQQILYQWRHLPSSQVWLLAMAGHFLPSWLMVSSIPSFQYQISPVWKLRVFLHLVSHPMSHPMSVALGSSDSEQQTIFAKLPEP